MPDPFKNVKIIELMELFDDEEVTTADKIDRPERALDRQAIDDFMERNPLAGGGMLVEPGFGGVRQGYKGRGGPRPNTGGDRSKYITYKKKPPTKEQLEITEKVYSKKYGKTGIDLWESLKQFERSNIRQGKTTGETGGVGKLKKNQLSKEDFIKLVNANRDKTYNEFVKVLENYRTKDNKPFTKPIIADRLSAYGMTRVFKKEPSKKDPTKKAETEKKRVGFLKETDPTGAKGTKKVNYHHIRQIAGGVPLTTDDVMLINQKINSQLGGETNKALNRISAAIQKNNRLALEAMNAKNEGAALDYMKRVDDLNAQAEKIVNSAINKLPKKYKGYVGFNQFTLPKDEYGLPISNEPMIIRKVGGMPVSKDAIDLTTLNLKQEQEFRKLVKQQADRGKVGKIDQKILQDIAKLGGGKCATQKFASGGRINLADSITCLRQGLENIKNKNLPGGPQQERIMKNLTDFTKTTQGARVLGSAARVVAGLGIGSELALGGFFAITDYATGANKQELLSNLTYGLAGKDVEEQLTEKDPMYGKAQQLEDVYAAYLQGLDKTGKPKTMDPRGMAQRTKAKDVEKAMEPFKRISPQTDTGQFFDLDMFETQKAKDIKAVEDFEKQKKERALERGFYDPDFDVFSPDRPAAAGGGLLKQAGDRSGAPPESGPNSQGLLDILKRGKKI